MIYKFNNKTPQIADGVFIAPNATIIGDVIIEAGASIWFGAVLRGDTGQIRIGAGSNVQDNCVLHVNGRNNTIIAENVTLGHGVIAEGCHIHKGSLVGMNATVLSGSIIGAGCLIAAGTVIRENQQIEAGMLVAGVPARVIRPLTAELQSRITSAGTKYQKYSQNFLDLLCENQEVS